MAPVVRIDPAISSEQASAALRTFADAMTAFARATVESARPDESED